MNDLTLSEKTSFVWFAIKSESIRLLAHFIYTLLGVLAALTIGYLATDDPSGYLTDTENLRAIVLGAASGFVAALLRALETVRKVVKDNFGIDIADIPKDEEE
jgi:hypothetical protein